MRPLLSLALAAALVPSALAQDLSAAEAAAQGYIEAIDARDFDRAAELFDPEDAQRLMSLFEMMPADEMLGFGEAGFESPVANLLASVMSLTEGLGGEVTMSADRIGSVAESDSLVHVLARYRVTMAMLDGVTMESVRPLTVRLSDAGWRVRADSRLDGMATMMEAQMGSGAFDSMGGDVEVPVEVRDVAEPTRRKKGT